MSSAPLPFGTAMALAERTLSAPLEAVLATEGLRPSDWFTLHALGLHGGSMPAATATTLLATNGFGAAAADALFARLSDAGLLARRDGLLTFTSSGAARYERVRTRVDAVTRRVFEPFDPALVEQTRAFLQQLAELDAERLRAMATASV